MGGIWSGTGNYIYAEKVREHRTAGMLYAISDSIESRAFDEARREATGYSRILYDQVGMFVSYLFSTFGIDKMKQAICSVTQGDSRGRLAPARLPRRQDLRFLFGRNCHRRVGAIFVGESFGEVPIQRLHGSESNGTERESRRFCPVDVDSLRSQIVSDRHYPRDRVKDLVFDKEIIIFYPGPCRF